MFLARFTNLFKSQKTLLSLPKYYFNDSDESYFRQSSSFRKSYTRPFTITSDDSVMSVNCIKGKFKQQQNYLTLDKMGVIILDFIPLKNNGENGKQFMDVRGKKNFTLNIKSVGEILKYNPYDIRNSHVKLEFKYYAGSLNEEKKLVIQKGTKEDNINFILSTQRQGSNSNSTIQVDAGDFIIMQELLRYSLPYMLGWHIMSSPRIAEEEISSNYASQNGADF